MMQRLKWICMRVFDAIGVYWFVAIGLMIAIVIYASLLFTTMRDSEARAMDALKSKHLPSLRSPSAQIDAFFDGIPKPETLSHQLEVIFNTASDYGVKLDEVSYRKVHNRDERLQRYYVDFAMNAPYVDTRTFLGDVLVALPSAALEQVSMSRDSIKSANVRARVRLTLFLVQ